MKYSRSTIPIVLAPIIVMLSTPASLAQTAIAFEPHWKAGQSFDYTFTKSRTQSGPGIRPSAGGATTPIALKVIESNDQGAVLGWTPGKTGVNDASAAANPLTEKMSSLMDGITVEIEVDGDGSVASVRNWEEVRAKTGEAIKLVVDSLRDSDMNANQLAAVENQISSMFQTQDQIETYVLNNVQLLFALYGKELSEGEPLEYEDELPNPFGGDPFPATGSFELTNYDADSHSASVTWTQTLDPERARQIMTESMKRLAEAAGRNVPEGELPTRYDIRDHAEFEFDTQLGLITRLKHQRTGTVDEQTRIDTVVYELVEKPQE